MSCNCEEYETPRDHKTRISTWGWRTRCDGLLTSVASFCRHFEGAASSPI